MSKLNILIVEGNIREDSEFFIKAAGATAADNLKNLILKIEPSINTEIINPGHDDETRNALKNMNKYVIQNKKDLVFFDKKIIKKIKNMALRNEKKRARICIHKSLRNKTNEMIIALNKKSFIAPQGVPGSL